MKKILILFLSVALVILSDTAIAQKVKPGKSKVAQKKTNHKVQKKQAQNRKSRQQQVVVQNKHVNHYPYVKRTPGHNSYGHMPYRGSVVNVMHHDARFIRYGNVNYRYYSGVWYRPQGSNWMVVSPSFGVRINTLPVGSKRIQVGPKVYHYYYGTYYLQKGQEYEVVQAPNSASIGSLPYGYNTVIVDGKAYYELDGIYYQPSATSTGEEVLIVINDPTL